jgi:gluconolactonase
MRYFFSFLLLALFLSLMGCGGGSKAPAEAEASPEPRQAELILFKEAPAHGLRLQGPIRKLAGDLVFTEGPVWLPDGRLLFTDVPANRIYQWKEGEELSIFMEPSGLTPADAPDPSYLGNGGANGLLLDNEGRLLICQHGNRQLVRMEPDSSLSVLASHFRGKRLNSPNDLAIRANGDIYFTDPPYGLPKGDQDPRKELPFNGVYRISQGEITLLDSTLSRPNGLAFSPDERHLYVAVSDPAHKVWYRYEVDEAGLLQNRKLLHDATADSLPGLPDGMVVDEQGRLFATGPGGVWVFDAEGELLARIQPAEAPANCTLGGGKGNTLFMTARTGLYAVELK